MSGEDSREIKPIVDKAVEIIERRAEQKRARSADDTKVLIALRTLCWGGAVIAFVIAFGLSGFRWADAFIPAVGVIHWFVAGMGAALMGALSLLVTINHRRSQAEHRRTNERMDLAATKLRMEIRDARPVDNEALGQMVAELQSNRALIRQLLDEVAANERQRQADFDMIRENSRKALEAVHERLDHLTAMVKAHDEAYVDLLSALEDAASKGDNALRLLPQPKPRPAN